MDLVQSHDHRAPLGLGNSEPLDAVASDLVFVLLDREVPVFLVSTDRCHIEEAKIIFEANEEDAIVLRFELQLASEVSIPLCALVAPVSYPFLASPRVSDF